jgi:hypothetical protein
MPALRYLLGDRQILQVKSDSSHDVLLVVDVGFGRETSLNCEPNNEKFVWELSKRICDFPNRFEDLTKSDRTSANYYRHRENPFSDFASLVTDSRDPRSDFGNPTWDLVKPVSALMDPECVL